MMNQTQKRLQIIKLAISITDIETVQLQVAKLRLLEGDTKIEEIVHLIDTKNYAQAQKLITEYIETPIQKIHQRVPSPAGYSQTEKELIDKFDLFVREKGGDDNNEFLDDVETFTPSSKNAQSPNYQALLQLDVEDVLKDNISIRVTQTENEDNFFSSKDEPKVLVTEDIPKDTFFDSTTKKEEKTYNEQHDDDDDEDQNNENEPEKKIEETPASESDKNEERENEPFEGLPTLFEDHATRTITYKPLSSIKERFQKISQSYPPIHINENPYPSVQALLMRIAHQSYNEEKIHDVLDKALQLAQSTLTENKAEASELILLCGATEDRFAKLIFARELYKGELFEKNIIDSFDLMAELAEEEYPEALCDLGQFYEHGIGTAKNRRKAKELYKKSMYYGIQRAKKHYDRLTGGIFKF